MATSVVEWRGGWHRWPTISRWWCIQGIPVDGYFAFLNMFLQVLWQTPWHSILFNGGYLICGNFAIFTALAWLSFVCKYAEGEVGHQNCVWNDLILLFFPGRVNTQDIREESWEWKGSAWSGITLCSRISLTSQSYILTKWIAERVVLPNITYFFWILIMKLAWKSGMQ